MTILLVMTQCIYNMCSNDSIYVYCLFSDDCKYSSSMCSAKGDVIIIPFPYNTFPYNIYVPCKYTHSHSPRRAPVLPRELVKEKCTFGLKESSDLWYRRTQCRL